MKVDLYAVYDVASGVYDGPIPGRADGEVIRNFSHMCKNGESKISQSPEDYTLFKVGRWNDGTGEVDGMAPVKLINGAEALANLKNGSAV